MQPITIRYPFRPLRRSLATGYLSDLFGLRPEEPPYLVADGLQLDMQSRKLVLFTGPSGSGKSLLLREVGRFLQAKDLRQYSLPDCPLIDAITGNFDDRIKHLSACGLTEPRLLLRRPLELSEGERFRFRLSYAYAQNPSFLLCDEFAANLDRPLAKVIAYNVRRLVSQKGIGCLLATTHEDIVSDLQPDLWVRCQSFGKIEVLNNPVTSKRISFADELTIEEGSIHDWDDFSKWHYRSHRLAFVKRVVLLKHHQEPIGICVFSCPAAALQLRSKYFGLKHPRSSKCLQAMNQQLWLLSRIVIHPTYRGAGIGSWFVHQACRTSPIDWIETLSAMGRMNPFLEKAGFVRVGIIRKPKPLKSPKNLYGNRGKLAQETIAKNRYSEPVYLVLDNRSRGG